MFLLGLRVERVEVLLERLFEQVGEIRSSHCADERLLQIFIALDLHL